MINPTALPWLSSSPSQKGGALRHTLSLTPSTPAHGASESVNKPEIKAGGTSEATVVFDRLLQVGAMQSREPPPPVSRKDLPSVKISPRIRDSENREHTHLYLPLAQEVERVERESLDRVRFSSFPTRANADDAVRVVMGDIGKYICV